MILALRAWLAPGLAVMAVGCAQLPASNQDTLSGRLAIRVDGQSDRSVSAGFELSGDAHQGRLVLTGPLGATAAQAVWAKDVAWLDTGHGRIDYADLDDLAAAALGERIPMAALFHWLRGQAWPGAGNAPRGDGVAGFEQVGWRIDLSRWDEGWLQAQRHASPVITVRARVERP